MRIILKTMQFRYLALSLAIMAHFVMGAHRELTLSYDGVIRDLSDNITYGSWKHEDGNIHLKANNIGENFAYYRSDTEEGSGVTIPREHFQCFAPYDELGRGASGRRVIYARWLG